MADADINSDLKYEESTTLVQKKLKYDTILSSPNKIDMHMKTVHEKLKCYNCRICKKSFGKSDHLKRHIKTIHERHKDYKCELCGK